MVTRKAFVVHLLGWAGGNALLALGACGGGDGTSMPQGGGGCAASDITGNHGHALVIPQTDLDSVSAMTYSIQGSADHDHLVTFSAAQLAQLKAGQPVTVVSTTEFGHSHSVTEAC